ncbi:hypothetical protein [Tomitella biformata]|uniref:hypothetical protein n=1 Tax=Tomitella biformata TaxID=630403 RepID=UPI000A066ECE|nr:hypothetical protein [Tomitella biformata]
MNKTSIEALVRELRAKSDATGKKVVSATVYGGNEKSLRQTLIVIAAGGELGEYGSPKEATIYVLSGRITLEAASESESWRGRVGTLLVMPPGRCKITADEDAALLVTVSVRR